MTKKHLMILLIPAFLLGACKKNDDNQLMSKTDSLTLDLKNLPASAVNEQYEGWIIVDGQPVSTGTFTVDENGMLSNTNFIVDETALMDATDFVLSIEPNPDSNPEPSAIKILGGSFQGMEANVNASHSAALGHGFENASGNFILATPTTAEKNDELSGVWFLSLASGSPMNGLNLPALPNGWVYEGWAVIDGKPFSTGTFKMSDMADALAPYSGMGMAPPFPGEDFVANAPSGFSFPVNLQSATIVISIEPSPDNSPMPFVFKPLAGMVPADAMDHKDFDLQNNVGNSFPYGSVMR